MTNNDKEIRIHLDISIPQNCGVVITQGTESSACGHSPTQQEQCKEVREKVFDTSQVMIPQVNHPNFPVKVVGSGSQTGVICAYGNAIRVDGRLPDEVFGYCYTGAVDADPPAGAPSATVDQTSGFWRLDDIPAFCDQSPMGRFQILKVWFVFHVSGHIGTYETVPFYGTCGAHTYCEGSGAMGEVASVPNVIYVPTAFVLSVDGFSKHLNAFNGTWPLQLVPAMADCLEITWRFDPSSPDTTIELIGNPADRSARVLLKQKATKVEYILSSGDWNPMNICEFSEVRSQAVLPGSSMPAIVTVAPC
ncbi:MAG: hypothetical protein ACI9HK_001940 [Pirellulaceae bacterium]|jgi:hypothetical protein